MASHKDLSFETKGLLADKEAAYEFLREYGGLEIADRIRRLREEHDLTQADLATALETTQSAVARLEDEDYRRYSLVTLQRVAKIFGLWPSVAFEPYQRAVDRVLAGHDIGAVRDYTGGLIQLPPASRPLQHVCEFNLRSSYSAFEPATAREEQTAAVGSIS